mmetsp:Transcript_7565/g.21396  ORF Transcript_7565/g.21396 Transcript_7565/m.21396 type:complete len:525 (+) Transcript_7565:261-1835(+)
MLLRPPFHAHSMPALVMMICSKDPPGLPDSFPPLLRKLARSMLARDATQRPTVVELLKAPPLAEGVASMRASAKAEAEAVAEAALLAEEAKSRVKTIATRTSELREAKAKEKVRSESKLTPEETAAAREAAAVERRAAAEARREQMRRDREAFRATASRSAASSTNATVTPSSGSYEANVLKQSDAAQPPRQPLFELVLPDWAVQTVRTAGSLEQSCSSCGSPPHDEATALLKESARSPNQKPTFWIVPSRERLETEGPNEEHEEGNDASTASGLRASQLALSSRGRILSEQERQAAVSSVQARRAMLESALGSSQEPAEVVRTQRELVAVMSLETTVCRPTVIVCEQLPVDITVEEALGNDIGIVGVEELFAEDQELVEELEEEFLEVSESGGDTSGSIHGGRTPTGEYDTSYVGTISALEDASLTSASMSSSSATVACHNANAQSPSSVASTGAMTSSTLVLSNGPRLQASFEEMKPKDEEVSNDPDSTPGRGGADASRRSGTSITKSASTTKKQSTTCNIQ